MLHYIPYSLLWLGVFQQGTTAGPVHTRREARPAEPTPINGQMQGGLAAPWPPSQIEWPFEKMKSTKWTKQTPPKDNDKPPKSDEGGEKGARDEISRAFISNACKPDQHRKIRLAWEEARELADAQTKFKDGYDYKVPHEQWLGEDWNGQGWDTPDFSARSRDNFSRLNATFSKVAPNHDYLYFECNDPKKECKSDKDGVTVAYSYSEEGHIWTNHYINICKPFESMPSLKESWLKFKDNKHEQKVIENFERSLGVAMFHKIWQLKTMVSKPQASEHTSEAQESWDLAKDKGTWWASENADSYTMDALAIYIQQRFSSKMSPVPHKELKKLDAEAFKKTKEPSRKEKYIIKALDDPKADPKNHPKIANEKDWKQITFDLWPDTEKPKEVEGQVKCYGATGQKYVIDALINILIDDFCVMAEKQGHPDKNSRSISRKRMTETANPLSITIDWEPGLDFKPDSQTCKRIMGEITDRCDIGETNKGGGEKHVGEVKYQWKPESP